MPVDTGLAPKDASNGICERFAAQPFQLRLFHKLINPLAWPGLGGEEAGVKRSESHLKLLSLKGVAAAAACNKLLHVTRCRWQARQIPFCSLAVLTVAAQQAGAGGGSREGVELLPFAIEQLLSGLLQRKQSRSRGGAGAMQLGSLAGIGRVLARQALQCIIMQTVRVPSKLFPLRCRDDREEALAWRACSCVCLCVCVPLDAFVELGTECCCCRHAALASPRLPDCPPLRLMSDYLKRK